jgi:hypothetical protein
LLLLLLLLLWFHTVWLTGSAAVVLDTSTIVSSC